MSQVVAVGVSPVIATGDRVPDVIFVPLPPLHMPDDGPVIDLLCQPTPAVHGDECRVALPPSDDMDFCPRKKITDYFVALGRKQAPTVAADGAVVFPSAFEQSAFYSPCEQDDSGTSSGSTGAEESCHSSDEAFIDDAVEEDPSDRAFVRRFLRAYTGKRRVKLAESHFRCKRGCASRRPHVHIDTDDDDGQC